MNVKELYELLSCNPVIAAFGQDGWDEAIASPCEILFCLKSKLSTIKTEVEKAHTCQKLVFVHIDLAEGIGKDREGLEFLKQIGVDGIISTKNQLIRFAKELSLFTVQRFFALDSTGLDSVNEMLHSVSPDMIEIMPGVLGKVIKRFANGSLPVIAGGLIETKTEVTEALSNGAAAVSTGKRELWYI